MTAEPYDERAVHHLNWAFFYGSFNVFVYFAGTGGADSPSCGATEIAGYDEPPAGQQPFPGCRTGGEYASCTGCRQIETTDPADEFRLRGRGFDRDPGAKVGTGLAGNLVVLAGEP